MFMQHFVNHFACNCCTGGANVQRHSSKIVLISNLTVFAQNYFAPSTLFRAGPAAPAHHSILP
jgi:hypothetical protein